MNKHTLAAIIKDGGACYEAQEWLKAFQPRRRLNAAQQAVAAAQDIGHTGWLSYLSRYLLKSKYRLPAQLQQRLRNVGHGMNTWTTQAVRDVQAALSYLDRRAARARRLDRVAATGTSRKRTRTAPRRKSPRKSPRKAARR